MNTSVTKFLFHRCYVVQSILIRAPVQEIVVENGRATGVNVQIGSSGASTFIPARRVVSGAGYVSTFKRLVRAEVLRERGIPQQLDVPQSAGFVMANIGKPVLNITPVSGKYNFDAFV